MYRNMLLFARLSVHLFPDRLYNGYIYYGMKNNVKIVIDDKIPFIRGVLESFAEVCYLPPAQITRQTVADADALIVRTRTRCDERLLDGSSVRFIGTATIGTDHIDIPYCDARGIVWKNASGCNAVSVAQYVSSVVARLALRDGFEVAGRCIGLVGVGHVGSQVKRMCRALGMRVLLNDPPREEKEGGGAFVSLEQIAQECDIISFHTPLTHEGPWSTFHLAGEAFFAGVKRRPVVVNAARGEVLDTRALLKALSENRVGDAVIDCWEGEPRIDARLLECAYVATPHIAGYSADGKANATRTMLREIARFFGWELSVTVAVPAPEYPIIDLSVYPDHRIERALLTTYDPMADCRRLKASPSDFETLRGNYGLRREAVAYTVKGYEEPEKRVLQALGFRLE